MPVDYSTPEWQLPSQNEGTVVAGLIQRSRQQQMERTRLGMEQEQWALHKADIQRQAQAATAKSIAMGRLQKYLTPQAEGGGGLTYEQVAASDPATILAAGQELPQRKQFDVRPGGALIDSTGKLLYQAPLPAQRPIQPQRPTIVRPGDTALGPDGKPLYTAPAVPAKPSVHFTEDVQELPDGTKLYGQRNSLTGEFKPYSSYGQEGGSVLERAARAAANKKADDLKKQASKDKAALQKQLDDPLALKKIADQLISANPKLTPHDAMEAAGKQIQSQIDAKDEILEGAEGSQEDKRKEADHFKAGTKVKNAKGEIKYLKTDGSLPEGWTPAQ